MTGNPSMLATAASARAVLSGPAIDRIASFLLSAEAAEGGFRNRAGRPDLYYTVFGLSALLALGHRLPALRATSVFLDRCRNAGDGSFIDGVSLVRCIRLLAEAGMADAADPERLRPVLESLQRYRSRDGGYSHERPDAGDGTLYAAFLAEQAADDAGSALEGIPVPAPLIEAFRTPDGAYANHAGVACGTAPVTAAAAILLSRRGRAAAALAALAALHGMRGATGGTRASATAPAPDLLSTATALHAFRVCGGAVPAGARAAAAAFIEASWSDEGGFCASPEDAVPDVEYTFYGVLALGALFELGTQGEHGA